MIVRVFVLVLPPAFPAVVFVLGEPSSPLPMFAALPGTECRKPVVALVVIVKIVLTIVP